MCDSCWIRQGGMNPSGNALLSKMWMQRPDVWIYTFNLVIHLSKVKQSFTFQVSLCRSWWGCWNSWPLCLASPCFERRQGLVADCRDNLLFQRCRREYGARQFDTMSHDQDRRQDMLAGMVTLLFWSLVRFNCARNSFEYWQPSMGLTWHLGLWACNKGNFARSCGCIISLTSSPWVPYFMCSPLYR